MAVVEAGLECRVVHRYDGEGELALIGHGLKCAHPGGRLLGDAPDVGDELGPLHHQESREVRTIVDYQVGLEPVHEAKRPLVLLRRGPRAVGLDDVAACGELVGYALVALVSVAVDSDVCAGSRQTLHQDGSLWLDDEAEGDAHAPELA